MPIKTLDVPVGENLNCDQLLDALREHENELCAFLVDNLEKKSLRATCDGFEIEDLEELADGQFALSFNYSWSAYYGCRDADCADDEFDSEVFTYRDGVAHFKRDCPVDRTPADEF